MKLIKNAFSYKLLILLLTVSILVASLTSCGAGLGAKVYDTKEEMIERMEEDFESTPPKYTYVYKYLRDWGLPIFNVSKFNYIESVMISYFNLEGGLPDRAEHAKRTALAFFDKYYDEINLSDSEAVTDALLICYVDAVGDPYSLYRPPEDSDDYEMDMSGTFGGIGVVVEYDYAEETITVTTVNIDSPAEAAGIRVGDLIWAVNGETVEEIGLTRVVNRIRGEIGTEVEITVIRGGKELTVKATRALIKDLSVDYTFDEENKIGYVLISSYKDNTYEQFAEAVLELEKKGARGFIFDMRNNPGGYLHSVSDIISFLVPNGHTIVTYQYKGSVMSEYRTEDDEYGGQTKDHFVTVPIVVLCNEYTASAGEIFTAAMRDYNKDGIVKAKIVGTNTYGKGIMQSTYPYYDGSSVTLTVAYYNPPSGKNYHGTGVAPDVMALLPESEIDPETGNYLPVEDTQYDVALEELLKLINAN